MPKVAPSDTPAAPVNIVGDLPRLLLLIPLASISVALARVEGKSPVNYLNDGAKEKLQRHTKKLLSSNDLISVEQLFEIRAK